MTANRPSATMIGMRTVLVVEDELRIARLVQDYLEEAGFSVVTVADGPGAVAAARSSRPDLIVLDLGIPGVDGLDVLRSVRRDSSVPVIIVTARTDEADRIVGLELGADDYVTKPFSPKELVARIRAVLRRADAALGDGDTLRAGPVLLDLPKRRAEVRGQRVDLTATEFELLLQLVRHPGRVYTRGQLLEGMHGFADAAEARSVDAHIKNLRKKLETDPSRPELILTVHGIGYRFSDA